MWYSYTIIYWIRLDFRSPQGFLPALDLCLCASKLSSWGDTAFLFFLFLCWAWRWKCKGSSVPLSLPPPVGPVDGEEVFQPTSLIRCHLFISLLRHPFSCYSQGGKATLRFYSPLSRLPLRLRRKWQRVAANPSCLWMTQELRRGRGRLARSGVHLPGMPFA